MFLIDIRFTDTSRITPELTNLHRAYLSQEYEKNLLMLGGRKEPRIGGVILSNHSNENDVRALMNADPFVLAGVADYRITQFMPVMASSEFRHFL